MSEVDKLVKYGNRPYACESGVPEEYAVQSCNGWYNRALELAQELDKVRAQISAPGWVEMDLEKMPNIPALYIGRLDVAKPLVMRMNDGKWYWHEPIGGLA